jgi:hypothetical protein
MMQAVIFRGLFWLVTELFLTYVELDNLADYSEFIFRFKDSLSFQRQRIERLLHPSEMPSPASFSMGMEAIPVAVELSPGQFMS